MLFQLSWMFLRFNRLEQLKLKLEKILGFRNMQEKLEKTHSPKTAKSRIERTQMYCEF